MEIFLAFLPHLAYDESVSVLTCANISYDLVIYRQRTAMLLLSASWRQRH